MYLIALPKCLVAIHQINYDILSSFYAWDTTLGVSFLYVMVNYVN